MPDLEQVDVEHGGTLPCQQFPNPSALQVSGEQHRALAEIDSQSHAVIVPVAKVLRSPVFRPFRKASPEDGQERIDAVAGERIDGRIRHAAGRNVLRAGGELRDLRVLVQPIEHGLLRPLVPAVVHNAEHPELLCDGYEIPGVVVVYVRQHHEV
jgi:hypothetical protein